MKYIDADKLKAEIERLKKLLEDHNYYLDNSEQALGYGAALDDMEKFLDTLSEEPDKSLEEAAIDFADNARKQLFTKDYAISSIADYDHGCIDGFIAGAEWQKSQMISALKNDGELPIEFIDKFHEIDHNAFQNGQKNMKEQMLKDAVEATVMATKCGDKYQQLLISDWNYMSDMCNGQKVRIVVLKEEKE